MTDAERPYALTAMVSAARQTHTTRILVCVTFDNKWIDQLVANVPARVDIFRLPLAPLGAVRNAASARVDTDFIAYLDGDDAWMPTKIADQIAAFDDTMDVLGTKHLLVRDDEKPFFFAMARTIPMPSSWLVRREFISANAFPEVRIGEDLPVWSAALDQGRAAVLDHYLLRYRVRVGSLSEGTPSMLRKRRFEQRSHLPGARPLMLGASYAWSTAVSWADAARGSSIRRVR